MTGAGVGQNPTDHPTASTGFVANYLDTEIGHQLVIELADRRHVTVTPAQLAAARSTLTTEITGVMSEILQTAQGQDPRYSCTVSGSPISGQQVLDTMPASFVDEQVQLRRHRQRRCRRIWPESARATPTCSGTTRRTGPSSTRCASTRRSSRARARPRRPPPRWTSGTPFAQATAGATQQGTIPCAALTHVAAEFQTSVSSFGHVAVGQASAPIDLGPNQSGSGGDVYLVVSPTKRTPTTYGAAKADVSSAVQEAGAKVTQTVLTAAERHASVSVDPRYGTWVPGTASVFVPFTPERSDVLNPSANQVGVAVAAAPARRVHVQRLTVARLRPHVTVVGLGPAGTDLLGGAAAALAQGDRVYLRTARHPAAGALVGAHAFDDLYEAAATFDEVYAGIAEALVAAAVAAAPEPVVYAVPGSPLVAERSVELLRADGRVEITIVPALSFLDLAWAALGIDPLAEGVRLVDAADFSAVAAGGRGPFLVAQCWSPHLLSEVKLGLPDEVG